MAGSRRRLLLTVLATLATVAGCAAPEVDPPPPPSLESRLDPLLESFSGDVGLSVVHLGTGETVSVRADELFPTASLVKVPIMARLFDRIEQGELTLDQKLTYTVDRRYSTEDLLGSFANNQPITLEKLVFLMISVSDNTASLWCQELAGTGTAINEWLEARDFPQTRVNSRTPGREAAYEKFGWGQTTPREMVDMLVRIRDRSLVSTTADEEMHRQLCRSYWDGEALAPIPISVEVASKQGAVSRSRSEVALVHAPSGDYAFCVITRNQTDMSWGDDNEGFILLRDVSRVLWEHFEGP